MHRYWSAVYYMDQQSKWRNNKSCIGSWCWRRNLPDGGRTPVVYNQIPLVGRSLRSYAINHRRKRSPPGNGCEVEKDWSRDSVSPARPQPSGGPVHGKGRSNGAYTWFRTDTHGDCAQSQTNRETSPVSRLAASVSQRSGAFALISSVERMA